MTMVMGELYVGRAAGQPVAEVAGTEAQVLRKAARFAAELGMPVELVVAGQPGVVRVEVNGTIVRK